LAAQGEERSKVRVRRYHDTVLLGCPGEHHRILSVGQVAIPHMYCVVTRIPELISQEG
jgi:hypothetical protein